MTKRLKATVFEEPIGYLHRYTECRCPVCERVFWRETWRFNHGPETPGCGSSCAGKLRVGSYVPPSHYRVDEQWHGGAMDENGRYDDDPVPLDGVLGW